MQLLVLVLMTVGLIWLAARAGLRLSDQTIAVLVRGFQGWASDGWPRGVQEEDRARPWGRPPVQPTAEPMPQPPLTRVQPAVHAR